MWYLKTRLGTFWVMQSEKVDHKYYLGIGDNELGEYADAASAAKHVYEQTTGYLKWDCQSRIKVPHDISDWDTGEPKEWL